MRSVLFFLLVFFQYPATAQETAILDGKSFIVQVVEKNSSGSEDEMPDERITFLKGKIHSSFGKNNDFPDAEFTVNIQEKDSMAVVYFRSGMVANPQKHTLYWTGEFRNGKIKGSAYRDRNGESSCVYEFEGVLDN